MRETEKVAPPWEMELTREDGKLVEIVVKATGDGELTFDAVREAMNTALGRLRSERPSVLPRSIRSMSDLRHAWRDAEGELTGPYLAQLAVTYAEVTAQRGPREVNQVLSRHIDINPTTFKAHVSKAREEGYLTPTTPGKGGGEATDKARDLLVEAGSGESESATLKGITVKRRT